MKGETLSEAELSRLKPMRGEGGRTWRAFCPFHGSDRQRSLRVDRESGRFQCFACEAWGYMDWAREEFKASKKLNSPQSGNPSQQHSASLPRKSPMGDAGRGTSLSPAARIEPPSPAARPLSEWLAEYQTALPGSLGEEYLADRKIPLDLARKLGVGYSPPGRWAHIGENGKPFRDWRYGRLVFPHTAPAGQLVNLYGRAIGERVPKQIRHDHLAGPKGYFNFPALERAARAGLDGEVFVCEGPFDALSLIAAKPDLCAVAIFGVQGWRHDWASELKRITFALDTDAAGQKAWRSLARQLALRGKKIRVLPPETFGGAKDLNEAWVDGILNLD